MSKNDSKCSCFEPGKNSDLMTHGYPGTKSSGKSKNTFIFCQTHVTSVDALCFLFTPISGEPRHFCMAVGCEGGCSYENATLFPFVKKQKYISHYFDASC